MEPLATVVYKRIAGLILEKSSKPYSMTLYWLRCKLSFSLLQLAIMCLKGSRSSRHHIDLVCAESCLDHLEFEGRDI